MAENITNLKVRFGADTKQFKKGMDDGKRAVNQFKNDAGGALDAFAQQFGVNMGALRGGVNKVQTGLKGLSSGFKSAAGASGLLTKAMKILKVALISTGIGALVVAFGTLISYFTKTQRGADKVSKVMAGLRAAFDVLIDRASMFGEGLFKIVTGRFKEGWDALKQSVKGVGEEIRNEARAATELEKARQALERREISFIKTKSQLKNEISDLILKTRDENIAGEERLKYIERAQQLQKRLSDEEAAIAEERVRILTQQQALGENMIEDDRELAEAEAGLNDIRKQGNDQLRELVNRYNEMTNKINANTKAILKEREELTKNVSEEIMPEPIKLGIEIDTNIETDKLLSNLKPALEEVKTVIVEFGTLFQDTFNNIAIGFAENIGLMLADADNLKSFGDIVKSNLGRVASEAGKIIMKAGIAFFALGEAFQKAITNPATALLAVAAGAALVAVGQAAQASLSDVAAGGSGTFSGAPTSNVFDTRTLSVNTDGATAQPVAVHVTGEFRQRGNDLVAVVNSANNQKSYRSTNR